MKGNKGYLDLGAIFDEVFEAAQDFKDEFHRNFEQNGMGGGDFSENPFGGGRGFFGSRNCNDENIDYYPNYSYPPMNVYMSRDRSLFFEFALAGFDEKGISLSFQGDYMVFSAKNSALQEDEENRPVEENIHYFKRRLKMKDIEKQKYYVPLDKYAQENVKAVYRNGILKVCIPPKDEPDQNDGIKIEIIKEGN
ncbi:MAG: Hsp20 family protein [Treponema sp.]|nr:Hsp20 family protein [Treponema sp.]